jgi:hypothetical protein
MSFVYKPVHVRAYYRIRYGALEYVREHYRSYPIR